MDQIARESLGFVLAPVVAGFIKRLNGKIFLVRRGDKWTLLTGKFEWPKEQELRQALLREVGEEACGLKEEEIGLVVLVEEVKEHIDIVGVLDTLPLDLEEETEDGGKRAVMTVFFCEVSEEGAERMRYEGGQDFYWANPSQEIGEGKLVNDTGMPLDRLGKRVIMLYLEKYPELRKRKIVRMAEWLREGLRIIFEKPPSSA